MIAATLALYVALYIALVIAYVAVLKYMAEKPEEVLAAQAEERAVDAARRSRPPPSAVDGPPHDTFTFEQALPIDLHGADGRRRCWSTSSATATTSASAC